MKTNFTFRGMLLLLSAITFLNSIQAQFETTFGSLDGTEEMADTRTLPNGNTVVLATTTSYDAQKILLCELSPSGEVIWFRTISEPGEPNVEYSGKGIQLDFNADGEHSGYFITGCRHGDVPQMLIIRTDVLGMPLWTVSTINVDDQGVMDEYGVSLERMDNGDIIATGNSSHRTSEERRFIVTRVTPDGTILWSHRYGSPLERQFVANGSCRGMRNGTNVIAVVGQEEEDGAKHTFLSCIKVGTGQEIWRQKYNSSGRSDNGYDVVQSPVTQRFVVVGNTESLEGYSSIWAFSANAFSGVLHTAAHYSVPNNNLAATAVCLNSNGSSIIIAGRRDSLPIHRMAFAMRVPLTLMGDPFWSYYYQATCPIIPGDEAVDRLGTLGYLLATTGKLSGAEAGNYDLHLTRFNVNGQHNLECAEIPFEPDIDDYGDDENLSKKKSSMAWAEMVLISTDQEYIQEQCENLISDPESSAVDNTESFSELSIDIFPNPIHPGDLLNIRAVLTRSAEVEIQLLDMTHRPFAYTKEYRDSGTQTFTLKIPDVPLAGVYFLRVTFATGQQRIIPLVVNR